MHDPYVKVLYYQITTGEGISYLDPEPLNFSNHLGDFNAANNRLAVKVSEHFAEVTDAREAIEAFLKSWEIDTDLNRNVGMLRFKFETADVIDRNPPSLGTPQVLYAKGVSAIRISSTASVHLACKKYPKPPTQFVATPDVQYAHRRWLAFRASRDPLPAMAYFVLTVAEQSASSRRSAAQIYQIELDVLNKIGELSSTRGSGMTARKADNQRQYRELTQQEKAWLELAVRALIRRLGEYASGAKTLVRITLSDFPSI